MYRYAVLRLAGGPADPELGYLCDVCIGGHNLNYLRKLRYHIFGYLAVLSRFIYLLLALAYCSVVVYVKMLFYIYMWHAAQELVVVVFHSYWWHTMLVQNRKYIDTDCWLQITHSNSHGCDGNIYLQVNMVGGRRYCTCI